MEENIQLNSYNTRGLGNRVKRLAIFSWLKIHHSGIHMLQETHSDKISENRWEREWGGKILFSHGNSSSKGVAILFENHIDVDIKQIRKDDNGRLLLLDCKNFDKEFILLNIYCPTKDNSIAQVEFLKDINLVDTLLKHFYFLSLSFIFLYSGKYDFGVSTINITQFYILFLE